MLDFLFFAAGLTLLYFGAEWLVRGAARIAVTLGITPVVIGLTVVAFGTSAPELVVSSLSALRGDSSVALGNVVGSNILNIALIVGLAAVIYPLRVQSSLIRQEMPIMIVSALAVLGVAWDGTIGRVEGIVLMIAFAAYLWIVVRLARRAPEAEQRDYGEFEHAADLEPEGESMAWDSFLAAGGIAALAVGAHLTVTAAVSFARKAGVSELLVGLTIVAIGTSLPELATSTIAAARKQADIAVANVVGSNIFNVLLILGVSAGLSPLAVDPALVRFDIPVSILLSLVLVPFALTRLRIERWEGTVLLAGYGAFTAYITWRAVAP